MTGWMGEKTKIRRGKKKKRRNKMLCAGSIFLRKTKTRRFSGLSVVRFAIIDSVAIELTAYNNRLIGHTHQRWGAAV